MGARAALKALYPTARGRLRVAISLTAIGVASGIAGCDDDGTGVPAPVVEFRTSFEQDQGGFVTDTADTGDPQVEWSVERSTEAASDGETSMRIEIDNLNDQTKVWIERSFDGLEPDSGYEVQVTFDFGSADWGSVNLWTLFMDADRQSPEDWTDFQDDAVTADTGNGATEPSGVLWETKTASFQVESDSEGAIHVAIGVWGTYEVSRMYFVDDVRVEVTDG